MIFDSNTISKHKFRLQWIGIILLVKRFDTHFNPFRYFAVHATSLINSNQSSHHLAGKNFDEAFLQTLFLQQGLNSCNMKIAVAKGDGIGPEIMEAVLSIFKANNVDLEYEYVEMGKWVFDKGFSNG